MDEISFEITSCSGNENKVFSTFFLESYKLFVTDNNGASRCFTLLKLKLTIKK